MRRALEKRATMRWPLALLLFPGLWIAGIGYLCPTPIEDGNACIYAAGWGILCYIAAWLMFLYRCPNCQRWVWSGPLSTQSTECPSCKPQKRSNSEALVHMASILVILVGSFIAIGTYRWIAFDPIGEISDNGVGGLPCEKDDLKRIANNSGDVAIIRRTACPGQMAGNWGLTYFIFAHKAGEGETRGNLILRYTVEAECWDSLPRVYWLPDRVLKISVAGEILEVTFQRATYAGIAIDYVLGPARFPPKPNFR